MRMGTATFRLKIKGLHTNPKSMKEYKQFVKDLDKAFILTHAEMFRAVEEVTGTTHYSLRNLAEMGHPYGVGKKPPLPPGVINKQTGEFSESFVAKDPRMLGNDYIVELESNDPKADKLLNRHGETPKMIRRPWDQEIQKRLDTYGTRALINNMAKTVRFGLRTR